MFAESSTVLNKAANDRPTKGDLLPHFSEWFSVYIMHFSLSEKFFIELTQSKGFSPGNVTFTLQR